MKRLRFVLFGVLFLPLLMAQDRVSMEPPVVKSTAETVSFSTRFSQFSPDKEYRLGVGSMGDLSGAHIELLLDDKPVGSLANFSQGHMSSWWEDAKEVNVRGYMLKDAALPSEGQSLVLRVSLPRAAADKAGKIYVLIAKKYGKDTWYVEDGAELTDRHW